MEIVCYRVKNRTLHVRSCSGGHDTATFNPPHAHIPAQQTRKIQTVQFCAFLRISYAPPFRNIDSAFIQQGASRYSNSFRTWTCLSVTLRRVCVCVSDLSPPRTAVPSNKIRCYGAARADGTTDRLVPIGLNIVAALSKGDICGHDLLLVFFTKTPGWFEYR